MNREDLADHVLYAADIDRNQYTTRGSSTVVDILLKSGLLTSDESGALKVAKSGETREPSAAGRERASTSANGEPEQSTEQRIVDAHSVEIRRPTHTININIQLELPEAEDAEVYDKLFSSLRKNLLDL